MSTIPFGLRLDQSLEHALFDIVHDDALGPADRACLDDLAGTHDRDEVAAQLLELAGLPPGDWARIKSGLAADLGDDRVQRCVEVLGAALAQRGVTITF